ncbi:hypothetical protein IG631_24078 [Alternaria alternata]|nr:hypothetical protein IG631_24078 [Alternaria alternata]
MVCVYSLLNLPLAFVPPVLEHVGYTGHDEWYFHLPAIFIGLVVCAVHSLLLLRQIWSQDESTPLARRTGIRFCIMSASEAVAFLALTGFFFCNKQLYEDLPVGVWPDKKARQMRENMAYVRLLGSRLAGSHADSRQLPCHLANGKNSAIGCWSEWWKKVLRTSRAVPIVQPGLAVDSIPVRLVRRIGGEKVHECQSDMNRQTSFPLVSSPAGKVSIGISSSHQSQSEITAKVIGTVDK